jgi:ubiquinone/menaquinone biosynthesis C-methylase UbiE
MNYYNEISEGYDELHGEEQLKKVKIILNELKIGRNDKILDVGCGTGFYLNLFKGKVVGIDPSQELIKQYKGKHKIICGKAEQLPFPNNYFDIVISVTAIQNFDDIETGLKEMNRVGKDKFVFSALKRSKKIKEIEKLIKELFLVDEIIEEDKDLIFFAHHKNI